MLQPLKGALFEFQLQEGVPLWGDECGRAGGGGRGAVCVAQEYATIQKS